MSVNKRTGASTDVKTLLGATVVHAPQAIALVQTSAVVRVSPPSDDVTLHSILHHFLIQLTSLTIWKPLNLPCSINQMVDFNREKCPIAEDIGENSVKSFIFYNQSAGGMIMWGTYISLY